MTNKASDQISTVEKRGICGICPAGCWVKVRLENGRLTAIAADADFPLGMLCRRGEHAPEIIYSKHRLRHPLRRVGPKGTNEFEPVTWDQAWKIIVERLETIKSDLGPEAVGIYTGRGAFDLALCDIFQPKGVNVSSASSVLFPFGSPNTMGVGALCYVSFAMIAPHVTMGRMLTNIFWDIENADFLLVWGTNPATDSPPLDMARLERAAARGAEIIVIDPRRTETARRCCAEWIPIRPGTDGALALGLINQLIEQDLYDETFASEWTTGFAELERYVQHYTPAVVEAATGVPESTTRRLAQRLAEVAGACPVMYTGLEYSNSGIQAIRAVFTLFALAGKLDVPGGIVLAMPGQHFPINRSCNVANPDVNRAAARERFPIYSEYRGESHATGLINAVLKDDPYPMRGLIVHGASILTSWPQTSIWREVLSKLDFLVCIDRQLTADAAYADVVLPATTGFENVSYMSYGPLFRIREQLIEPVGEARNDYLIMAELAARLGYAHLYPQTEQALLETVLDGSGFALEEVRKAGGTVSIKSPIMSYRKWEKGLLRSDGKPGFDTPTGKFEIASSILADYGYEPLPKYTEPTEGPLARPDLAERYPLVFNSGARTQYDFRSQHHGIKGLASDFPEPIVEMNTIDALSRGIKNGDLVEVRSPRGAVPFRARVSDDIVPGAIEANMGGGGPVGPAAWQDRNVNELTDLDNYDEISGFPVYKALLCEVTRLAPGGGDLPAAGKSGSEIPETAASYKPKEVSRRLVYLDNNATTIPDPLVVKTVQDVLCSSVGNPSSIHFQGREAKKIIEEARRKISKLIGAKPRRVVFTGGGSEANNLALKGAAFARRSRGRHVVTTRVEHPSVLKTCQFLEKDGYEVTFVDVDHNGLVSPEAVEAALTDETVLVSVMLANNEVGTIQPVKEIAKLARAREAWMHTDAVQAVGKIPVDVEELGVDLLTVSAHKFHGPKGVGALFVRKGINLEPHIHGGHQEAGLRAGTENVAAIAGMGRAAELAVSALDQRSAIVELRNRLEAGILSVLPNARLNGPRDRRLPNTLNMTLPGLRGESLVIALDHKGVALSSASACKAGDPEPSQALIAMGLSENDAHCSVRYSLSRYTTEKEIEEALAALREVLVEMETTVRFLPCK